MQNVIERDTAQRKLIISAIIPGTPVGPHSFTSFSRCRSATQTGCIVNWDAYWSNQPPGSASVFGHVLFGTQPAQCVNPVNLGGGRAPLLSIFSAADTHAFNDPSRDSSIRTPWIELPGIVSGQCVVEDGYGFFAVTSNTQPTDNRVQDLDLLSLSLHWSSRIKHRSSDGRPDPTRPSAGCVVRPRPLMPFVCKLDGGMPATACDR
jgi:hypothetical protein